MKGFPGERINFTGMTALSKQKSYSMTAPGKQSPYNLAAPARQGLHITRCPGIHEPTEFERSGLDAEKLGFMDIGERRAVLIGAGLDPDKYDF